MDKDSSLPEKSVIPITRDDEKYVRQNFWTKVKRNISHIPFVLDIVALYYCALDPLTPKRAKIIAFSALAYFILPLDVIPDFLVIAGWTDDAVILTGAIRALSAHLTDEHRKQARHWADRDK